jgi:hypothetical protein
MSRDIKITAHVVPPVIELVDGRTDVELEASRRTTSPTPTAPPRSAVPAPPATWSAASRTLPPAPAPKTGSTAPWGEITQEIRAIPIEGNQVAYYMTQFTYDTWNRTAQMVYPVEVKKEGGRPLQHPQRWLDRFRPEPLQAAQGAAFVGPHVVS